MPPDAAQLLAVAAVITALAALVTSIATLVKMLGELRVVAKVAVDTHSEVTTVKALVNGNHSDLVDRLDTALAQRDEARARSPREGDPHPKRATP